MLGPTSYYCHPSSNATFRACGFFDIRSNTRVARPSPPVDTVKGTVADAMVSALNRGAARIELHRPLGTRIVADSAWPCRELTERRA